MEASTQEEHKVAATQVAEKLPYTTYREYFDDSYKVINSITYSFNSMNHQGRSWMS